MCIRDSILTVVAAVFPAFAVSVSVMSKDHFAGIFWIPFLVLFVETVRTRGRVLCRPWVGAAAIALAIPLVLARRPNVYVLILCVVVLLVISVSRARKRLLVGTALVLVVTSLVWPRIVLPGLGVRPGKINDMLTVPVQQTARTAARHGDSIPASERAAIDAVLRWGTLAKVYQPRRSAPVVSRWQNAATTEQKLAYARVWFAQLTRYPGTYLAATANITFPFFAPVTPVNYPNEQPAEDRRARQARYVDGFLEHSVEGTTREQIEEVVFGLYQAPALTTLRSAVNKATMAAMTGNVLASMAFYCSWLPLFVLGFALRRRSWLLALATTPLFINLLILVAGPRASGRYIVPMVLGSVLLAGLAMIPVHWLPVGRSRERSQVDPIEQTGAAATAQVTRTGPDERD